MNRAWWGHRLWQLTCLPEAVAFHLGSLRATQERLLTGRLQEQSSTVFGHEHQVGRIRSYEEFRDRIPISSYEELLPYLQQPNGLSPQPAKVWEPTGGSTGGSKWIPWTASLQAEFRRAVSVWIFYLLFNVPEVVPGRGYWQLTPKTELVPPDWLQDQRTGFEKDSDYLGRLGRWLERSVLVVPPQGPPLWETTVSMLREARDLRLISCWSPSFLIVLQEKMIAQLGAWEPQRWWPHLKLISCWTQAASGGYRSQIQQLFPGVEIQPKGLLSTEAVTTIPVGGQFPLAYRSHIFEFEEGGRVLPAWQLQLGQEATVIVSNGSGFTRYNTKDRVRVTGFRRGIPCLEFLGRDGFSDQRGEKLSFAFLDRLLEEIPGFAMLAYEGDGYVLFVDETEPIESRLTRLRKLENDLMTNYSYADCRRLGQLHHLRGFLVEGDAHHQFRRASARWKDSEEATIKFLRFHPYQSWSREFEGEFLP